MKPVVFGLTAVLTLATARGALLRAPYIQNVTTNSAVLCWRTDIPQPSRVAWGMRADALESYRLDEVEKTNHQVAITGLRADARYWYAVGAPEAPLAAGLDFWFQTAPMRPRPVRVWVIGDTRAYIWGWGSNSRDDVLQAYRRFAAERPADLWLHTGDISNMGYDDELQEAFFDVYPSVARNIPMYACLGNHDLGAAAGAPSLESFVFPSEGEAGGVPSGTERYYSFDYGGVHFVVLDSYGSAILELGYMDMEYLAEELAWLEEDLTANTNKWLIAMFHSPPYSMGSHNSDWEWDLMLGRTNFVPVLERYGADLVLNGHSHSYERSYLLRGHYGTSSTFEESMKVNSGDGHADIGGPYYKADGRTGTVYAVVGSSGFLGGGSFTHPAMFYGANELGSLVVDVSGDTLQAQFVRDTGEVADYFTIVKGSAPPKPVLTSSRVVPGGVELTWEAVLGWQYEVCFQPELFSPFEPITERITAVDTRMRYQVETGTPGFYRVRCWPE